MQDLADDRIGADRQDVLTPPLPGRHAAGQPEKGDELDQGHSVGWASVPPSPAMAPDGGRSPPHGITDQVRWSSRRCTPSAGSGPRARGRRTSSCRRRRTSPGGPVPRSRSIVALTVELALLVATGLTQSTGAIGPSTNRITGPTVNSSAGRARKYPPPRACSGRTRPLELIEDDLHGIGSGSAPARRSRRIFNGSVLLFVLRTVPRRSPGARSNTSTTRSSTTPRNGRAVRIVHFSTSLVKMNPNTDPNPS